MNGTMQAVYVPKWKKIFSTFTCFSKLKFHTKKTPQVYKFDF